MASLRAESSVLLKVAKASVAKKVHGPRHQDRRMDILRVAAELFAENGYQATSLDTIADRVGIHKATLYHYVPNKESILYQCLTTSFGDLDEVITKMRDKSVPVNDRLRLFARSLALAQSNVFGRCLVLVGEFPLESESGEEIRRFKRKLDSAVRTLVQEGIASGAMRSVHAGMVSALLFGALNWVPHWYRDGGRLSVEAIADAFVDLITQGTNAESSLVTAQPKKRKRT
jgi:AcrR family transcriptional regulator